MNNKELIAMLQRAVACSDAIEWVGQRDLKTAWAECQHADWMAWGLAKMTCKPGWPTPREIVSIAVYCARRAYRFVEKDLDNSIINCIEAVEAWVENPCEETRREATRAALKVAYAPYPTGTTYSVVNSVVINSVPHLDADIFDIAQSVAYAVDTFRIYGAEHAFLCNHIRQTVKIPI